MPCLQQLHQSQQLVSLLSFCRRAPRATLRRSPAVASMANNTESGSKPGHLSTLYQPQLLSVAPMYVSALSNTRVANLGSSAYNNLSFSLAPHLGRLCCKAAPQPGLQHCVRAGWTGPMSTTVSLHDLSASIPGCIPRWSSIIHSFTTTTETGSLVPEAMRSSFTCCLCDPVCFACVASCTVWVD